MGEKLENFGFDFGAILGVLNDSVICFKSTVNGALMCLLFHIYEFPSCLYHLHLQLSIFCEVCICYRFRIIYRHSYHLIVLSIHCCIKPDTVISISIAYIFSRLCCSSVMDVVTCFIGDVCFSFALLRFVPVLPYGVPAPSMDLFFLPFTHILSNLAQISSNNSLISIADLDCGLCFTIDIPISDACLIASARHISTVFKLGYLL